MGPEPRVRAANRRIYNGFGGRIGGHTRRVHIARAGRSFVPSRMRTRSVAMDSGLAGGRPPPHPYRTGETFSSESNLTRWVRNPVSARRTAAFTMGSAEGSEGTHAGCTSPALDARLYQVGCELGRSLWIPGSRAEGPPPTPTGLGKRFRVNPI